MRIARVFPRRTNATPTDDLAFVGEPGLFPPEVNAVHVSIAFTWDLRRAEELARAWESVAPVSIGGPATGDPSGEFQPGLYLKPGYVITSRGCPNHCWFCNVPKREGAVRELPIVDGYNVLDDNLLACSEAHIRDVFAMLARQPQRAEFTGGLEAARLEPWHVDLLADLKPVRIFLAYDETEDWEPLVRAAGMLKDAGRVGPGHHVRCYVLVGYPGDTEGAAEHRLRQVMALGVMPMAMLWRTENGQRNPDWVTLQRQWANPWVVGAKMKREGL